MQTSTDSGTVAKVSLCFLLYGDYVTLAHGVAHSLRRWGPTLPADIRIGFNASSEHSKSIVLDALAEHQSSNPTVAAYVWDCPTNCGKYPLMRRMFCLDGKDDCPLLSEYVAWFDDDSTVTEAGSAYVSKIADSLKAAGESVVQAGCTHLIKQRGYQYEWIMKQPWYTGKEVNSNTKFRFATGGFWVADSSFLIKHDYPFKEIYHNGGDSILGELIRQQGCVIQEVSGIHGVRCGCESCSWPRAKAVPDRRSAVNIVVNAGGRRGRRGIGTTGERYVGSGKEELTQAEHQVNFYVRRATSA